MKRNGRKFDLTKFIKELPHLSESTVEIWIDEDNKKEILSFLFKKKKSGQYINRDRFRLIINVVLSGKYNRILYDKEEVSKKAKNVTAMKFTRGKTNFRIGCKEFSVKGKKVVMICLFDKDSEDNEKKIKTVYEIIGGYEYEF